MTRFSDGWDEMRAEPPLDEHAAEALLAGRQPAPVAGTPDVAPLVDVISELRSWGAGPAPLPTPALMSLFEADGADLTCTSAGTTDTAPVPHPSNRRKKMLVSQLLAKLAGLGVAAKAALGTGLAAASLATVGATGVLPDQVGDAVGQAVTAVTPFNVADTASDLQDTVDPALNLPDLPTDGVLPGADPPDGVLPDGDLTGENGEDGGGGQPANHGACVSAVARDRSVQGREHGAAVSAMAQSDCGKTSEDELTPGTESTTTTSSSIPDDGESTLEESLNRGSGNGGNRGNRGPSGNNGPGNSGNGN